MNTNIKQIPVFELSISNINSENETQDGIIGISLVDNPAIQIELLKFNQTNTELIKFKTIDEDKRIVISPLLIPGQYVYRYSKERGEYYVVVKPESMEGILKKMSMLSSTDFNLNHNQAVNDIYILEKWLIDNPDKDKSSLYFDGLPKNTIMVSLYIHNKQVWQDYLKSGFVSGLSMEGIFTLSDKAIDIVKTDKKQPDYTLNYSQDEVILNQIKAILEEE